MNIMLACAGGISTNLIVDKMLNAAKNEGKDYTIWAVDEDSILDEIGKKKVDIILLGPQIAFKLKSIQAKLSGNNIPVYVMESMAYGMNDGKKILHFAEKKLQK